jgi:hypothetical protein
MKKIAVFLAVFLGIAGAVIGVYADEINIDDYFPTAKGTFWLWVDRSGRMHDGLQVFGRSYDETYGMDHFLGYTYNSLFPDRKGNILYAIDEKGVYKTITIAIGNGRKRYYDRPYYKILGLPGAEWTFIDEDGAIENWKASRGSINFDGNNYPDCILVEMTTTVNNKVVGTLKYYYAKNVGLVYVTIDNGPNTQERVFQKLIAFQMGKQGN